MEKIIYNSIEFEQIKEFPNYAVSRCGKVLSLNYNKIKGFKKLLKSVNDKDGYLIITFSKNCQEYKKKLHRLVAEQFILNPENKPQVNHINGIKNDNKVENLEWCNASYNQKHSFRVLGKKNNFHNNHPGKGKFGGDSIHSVKIDQFDKQNNFIKTWDSISDIQRKLNINSSQIIGCCKKKLHYNYAKGYIWKYHNSIDL